MNDKPQAQADFSNWTTLALVLLIVVLIAAIVYQGRQPAAPNMSPRTRAKDEFALTHKDYYGHDARDREVRGTLIAYCPKWPVLGFFVKVRVRFEGVNYEQGPMGDCHDTSIVTMHDREIPPDQMEVPVICREFHGFTRVRNFEPVEDPRLEMLCVPDFTKKETP